MNWTNITACFLLLTGINFHNPCFAQHKKFEFGGKVGASFTTLLIDNRTLPSNMGLSVGALLDYPLSEVIKFQANVDYHQLSGTTIDAGIIADGQYANLMFTRQNRLNVNLAEVSLSSMYRVPFGFLGSVRPFVMVGGSGGYNFFSTRESVITNPAAPSLSTHSKTVITDSISKYVYALHSGIHFEWPVDEGVFSALIFDFRYQRNINPISVGNFLANENQVLLYADDIKAHSLITTIGFKF